MNATQPALFDYPQAQRELDLESVLEFLDSIPYINSGGCGISALAIYRWHITRGSFIGDRPFVILPEDEWDLQNNSRVLTSREFKRLSLSHIGIEIDNEVCDSTGEVDRDYFIFEQPERLNETELLECLNNNSWNSFFNRERAIPIIETELNIDLSDIKI